MPEIKPVGEVKSIPNAGVGKLEVNPNPNELEVGFDDAGNTFCFWKGEWKFALSKSWKSLYR